MAEHGNPPTEPHDSAGKRTTPNRKTTLVVRAQPRVTENAAHASLYRGQVRGRRD